ncbi:MAG: transglutaminase-like domain-containing protein, partial [Thermoproteota archaeon]
MLGGREEERLEPAARFRAYGLPPPPEKRWRNISIVFMVATVLCLILFLASFTSYNSLNDKYWSLNSEYLNLKVDYNQLQAEHESLQRGYDSLKSDYDALRLEHDALERNYSSLQDDYRSLQYSFNRLQSDYADLQEDYRILQSSYSDAVNDRQALLYLVEYLNETSQLLYSVISIRKPIAEECCSYITIDDPQLRSMVQSITGGWAGTSDDLWDDLEKLQGWVVQNIKYSYDTYTPHLAYGTYHLRLSSKTYNVTHLSLWRWGGSYWQEDFWRFPNETLADRHGDCEDQAVLLTSMVRCYFKYCVGTLYNAYAMVIGGPGMDTSHAAVVIPVAGGKLMILDPAGKYVTGLDLFITKWVTPRPVEEAVNDYLRYWQSSGYAFTRVDYVFNEATYKSFNSLSDFVSWISR